MPLIIFAPFPFRDDDILYVSEGEDFQLPNPPAPGVRPPGHVGTRLTPTPPPPTPTPGVVGGDWVTLNVGGRIFTTTRATLVTKEPHSMLAKYVCLSLSQ